MTFTVSEYLLARLKAPAQAEAHTGPGQLVIVVHVEPWDASEAFTLMCKTLRSH